MGVFLFGISMGEMVLIFLVVLMLFGSKKIPELARALGKGMNEFRRATNDIKREFEENTEEIREDLEEMEKNIRQHSREIQNLADETHEGNEGDDKNSMADVYGLDQPERSDEPEHSSEDQSSENDQDLPKDSGAANTDQSSSDAESEKS